MKEEKTLVDVRGLAIYLGICRDYVYSMLLPDVLHYSRGDEKHKSIIRVSITEVLAWLKQCTSYREA